MAKLSAMRNILPLLPKPSRYAGIEEGICIKDPERLALRIALAFPDTYEIGMSYLGQKILYGIVNDNPAWWAERVMAPEREAAQILRARNVPLCTLESGTPLRQMDAIGFSITHELCYSDVLHMLDLAQIPLRASARGGSLREYPIIMGGGGAILGAEPLVPFLDLALLGDGEETLPEVLSLLQDALEKGWSREKFLRQAANIGGVYVPSLFHMQSDGSLSCAIENYRPARRIVPDLNQARFPARQVVPLGAVHNRLSLEIARGCPRGCRFCHAGMVYRPLRERGIGELERLLHASLDETGFEEVSFLALSAGDFSGLKTLYNSVYERCSAEQISLSLPSLRVGSVDDEIMAKIASLRRTGFTLAPEAASQRLRDVINKGITEEALLSHAQKLIEHGWKQVKLYFMIGLPTETDADIDEIANLCRKVRDSGGKGAPKLAVTASLSPFVPKPFTPFQWEAQIGRAEIERRVGRVLAAFKGLKGLTLRWHNPDVSHLEGILSRGDRRLADVVEKAYRKGAIFNSWTESFNLEPWLEALAECGFSAEDLIGARNPERALPWDHLEAGISRDFLLRERKKAYEAKTTLPCSENFCGQCGACDTKAAPSLLWRGNSGSQHMLRVNNISGHGLLNSIKYMPEEHAPTGRNVRLTVKAARYRIWHAKLGGHAFTSQLELQDMLARAMRRAGIPLAFSGGYHPMPLISFGRALPVGVGSHMEWLAITLHTPLSPEEIKTALNHIMDANMRIALVERADALCSARHSLPQSVTEEFSLEFDTEKLARQAISSFENFSSMSALEYAYESKKGKKSMDIRPLLFQWQRAESRSLTFSTNWQKGYISPLRLVSAILSTANILGNIKDLLPCMSLSKTGQIFPDGSAYRK